VTKLALNRPVKSTLTAGQSLVSSFSVVIRVSAQYYLNSLDLSKLEMMIF